MNQETKIPQGRLLLLVRSPQGQVLARRQAHNLVLRQGAAIIARLFSGQPDVKPINQIQVGFAKEAGTPEITSLTLPSGEIPLADLRSPIAPENFVIATDKPGLVQVSVSAVFKPAVDLPDVSEAGLLSGELLYNQVVFEPVTLKVGQEVTFFWEVDFPFGH
jgi:hypothetical protein